MSASTQINGLQFPSRLTALGTFPPQRIAPQKARRDLTPLDQLRKLFASNTAPVNRRIMASMKISGVDLVGHPLMKNLGPF